jgi:ribosomal protein S18 acetylase RimI-like enzyme
MELTMDIRPMTPSDINTVVRIHERVLPTATSRMGLLPFFYQTLITHPDIHRAFVATENNQVIGAITATRDARKTQTYLTKLSNLIPLLHALIYRRVTAQELLDRMFTERAILRTDHPYQTILTLVVDTPWQRKGVGKKLVSTLNTQGKLYVDTETSNIAAQSFYRRCGFRFIKTIRSSMVAVKTLKPAP